MTARLPDSHLTGRWYADHGGVRWDAVVVDTEGGPGRPTTS
ncbi:hypothetical protein [Geodermatophilus sp. SYSU D00079]